MDIPFYVILIGAVAAVAGGLKMMYCGHREQVRHNRRSTDK